MLIFLYSTLPISQIPIFIVMKTRYKSFCFIIQVHKLFYVYHIFCKNRDILNVCIINILYHNRICHFPNMQHFQINSKNISGLEKQEIWNDLLVSETNGWLACGVCFAAHFFWNNSWIYFFFNLDSIMKQYFNIQWQGHRFSNNQ